MKMIDVGAKEKTARTAVATAQVRMLPATIRRIREGKVEKGGVMAAKRTPDLIPLCHPISLSAVSVELALSKEGVEIRSEVKTVDRTGVEMEALTAVCTAALTVYDMLKGVDRGMTIERVQLEHKSGGRSGTWERGRESAA